MSSILRALKKLEHEPRHQEKSPPLENRFVPSADTGKQRPVSNLFFMVVGTGIVCGLVILAGWWFFSEKAQTPPAVPPPIHQPDSSLDASPGPPQSINVEQGQAVNKERLVETPEIQKVTEQPRATESADLKTPAVGIIPEEDVVPAEEPVADEAIPAQEVSSLKESEQAIQPAEKPQVVSAAPRVAPAKTVEVEIPKLNDPDMKLQAVTWSRVPQKRIAVINNRIVREGDLVSGYFINTINQDDVVVSKEGGKWKLAFH